MALVNPTDLCVDRVDVKVDELVVFTASLMLKCYKLARVQKCVAGRPPLPKAPSEPAAAVGEQSESAGLTVCDALLPAEMGAGTLMAAVAEATMPQALAEPSWQSYWAMLRWKIPSVFYDRCAEQLSAVMPDFTQAIERQLQMSACGVSLPMHGAAAVGHTQTGLYSKWLFCEGILLTQPSLCALITTTLRQYHKTSVHPGPVGIICLSRPEVLLSDMSLEHAKWVRGHSSIVQRACT